MNIRKISDHISKNIGSIENAVAKKLHTFWLKKIKPLAVAGFPVESIRRKYETEIKTIIRTTVQKAYLEGTAIVTDVVQEKNSEFQPFISVTDITNIQQLTEKLNNQFWKTTGRLITREQEFIVQQDGELEKKKSFDVMAAMIGMAGFISFKTFNDSVVSKMQSITPLFRTSPVALGNMPIDNTLSLDVGFDINVLPENIPGNELEGKFMFLTKEDAKVDPEICEPLDREVFSIDDPDLPDLPLHNHCRCRLIPILVAIEGEAAVDEFTQNFSFEEIGI